MPARLSLLLVAVALLGVALLAAGCGDDEDEAAATAATAAATAAVTEAPAYPVEVTDQLGRTVQIAARPVRVVGLSPSAVEFVYAAGGTVVGRTASVDYPVAAQQATDVGSAYQPSMEAIIALEPDLVVADAIIHAQPQLRSTLEALDVPVIFAGAESYAMVLEGLRLAGTVFDASDATDALIAEIEAALVEAKAVVAAAGEISAVVMIADRDQTLYAAKATGYVGDLVAQLGITNPAATEPDSGPFPGYTALAPEKLIQFDPDFILTITPAPEPAPRLNTIIPMIPPFAGLKAVTGEGVVELDLELFMQAPGPRVGEAFEALAAAVTAQ